MVIESEVRSREPEVFFYGLPSPDFHPQHRFYQPFLLNNINAAFDEIR